MAVRSCRLGNISLDVSSTDHHAVLRDSLFWPTVGPIFSGGMPGVGLYSVFIFSNIVYTPQLNPILGRHGAENQQGTNRFASLSSVSKDVRLVEPTARIDSHCRGR